jgi:hypothetical protein
MISKAATIKIGVIAIGLLLFSLPHRITWADNATLSWYPPATYVSGTALTNLAGYKVYYGTVSSTYTQVMNVGLTSNPAAPAYTLTALAAGSIYFFAVTAYDSSGNESAFSNEVSKSFMSNVTTTTTTVRTTTTTTTLPVGAGPGFPVAAEMTSNIMTTSGVTQIFTATFSDPNGWQNLSDASFYLLGGGHDQQVHFNPLTHNFTLDGAAGSCTPGQPAILSNTYLTLNCSISSYTSSGNLLTVTYTIIPRTAFSGFQYRLFILATDKSGNTNAKNVGNWTVYLITGKISEFVNRAG